MRDSRRHIRYTRHNPGFGYASSPWSILYSNLIAPLLLLVALFGILWFIGKAPAFTTQGVSLQLIGTALVFTIIRLAVSYLLALAVAIPLALLVVHSRYSELLLLPFFDILQSIPVLAFFPLLVIFFVHGNFLNGAAIFILFLSMVWNIVFSLVGGLKVIPGDIKSAANVFGIKGWKYLRWVTIPAAMPYLVTGSILAWAQGWNILIVAEVLHTYIPGGTSAQDLLGVGDLLVKASSSGQNMMFMYVLIVLTAVVALMNLFVWQKLLHYAERFKFE